MTDIEQSTKSLENLPTEILINILSYLDEKDLYAVQATCRRFLEIINDEELWKNLFISRIHTRLFPSFSRSAKYSVEYVERNRGLSEWKHNRAVKTKFTVTTQNQNNQLEKMVFEYPRCACYSDGVIMLVQLHSRRRKDRLTYMPCTTPHGCSTMHFNINAAVFGRFDGRVFGKLLTNKSHLCPVTEFNAIHSSSVTAITTSALEDSPEDWCVSGCKSGQVIWWCEAKKRNAIQISDKPILRLALHKDLTVIMDSQQVYVVDKMDNVHKLDIPSNLQLSLVTSLSLHFEVDFGGKLLILGDMAEIYVISINPHQDFGFTKSIHIPDLIEKIFIDDITSKRTQDASVAGGDGCYLGILTGDNSVAIINVRAPGSKLRIQTKLSFVERVHTAQITNLVMVCAFSGSLGIFDASSGTELRVVRKTEKFPQFLGVSHGRMIVGSGNVLHYLQYSDQDFRQKKSGLSQTNRSNKWNEVLNSQLDLYNEDENSRIKELERKERLRQKFVGDLDDEEIQLEIALIESQAASEQFQGTNAQLSPVGQDEELQRAIEESRLAYENLTIPEHLDEDAELLRAIQQSQEEENIQRRLRRSHRRVGPLGEIASSSELSNRLSSPEIEISSVDIGRREAYDEDFEVARALSMQDMR
ncbi:LANO_0G06194g1_1 [Lachancea nothofagi CBS 11611]|uniref:LANO_0G06194g1_1 n=1 Tax=Lachancea nothofagi CBS 11611 TaxID=1266666 RepID=A0A1G4KGZ0_9SACH|nr:LANO_0G06194g1_1 [Lachancea nothofagi CBS 11611]